MVKNIFKSNSELTILTRKKKVILSIEGEEEKKVVFLHPIGWKNFCEAIKLATKYWGAYSKTSKDYKVQKQAIINETAKDKDNSRRLKLLAELEVDFDETETLIQNIFTINKDTFNEDIESAIKFCLKEDLDLNSLHIGEITCLLSAVIEVNMDFFTENMKKIIWWMEEDQGEEAQQTEMSKDGD